METASLSSKQILLMSITAGICVANIYYSQPILAEIAKSLGTDVKSAGFISVLSQAGYGLGLLFITPLGDKFDRKKLILILQLSLIAALLVMAFSANKWMIYGAGLAIGTFAVAAQVILPMAASLVSENRGKVVGIIFTGILVGILSARIFSGYITEWLGWRYVYGVSSVMVLGSAILMQADFPAVPPNFTGSYKSLLSSVLVQFRRFSVLRRTAFIGALSFGTLSAFWVALTFHLSEKPFEFSADKIGLFGFLAVGGTLAAPLFGKLADKSDSPRKSLLIALSFVFVSLVAVTLFPASILALCFAVLFLDMGIQAVQVTNIAVIYTLDAKANSRINTVYMTTYFVGGAVGSALGIWAWERGGWMLVMGLLFAFVSGAVVLAMFQARPKVESVTSEME